MKKCEVERLKLGCVLDMHQICLDGLNTINVLAKIMGRGKAMRFLYMINMT